MTGGSLKAAFLLLAAGKVLKNSFVETIIEEVRDKLRILLRNLGHGGGLPQEGDMQQEIEVRLMQALMRAFGDPDYFYGDFLARGVWLGSKARKLPRTPLTLREEDEAAPQGFRDRVARQLEDQLHITQEP